MNTSYRGSGKSNMVNAGFKGNRPEPFEIGQRVTLRRGGMFAGIPCEVIGRVGCRYRCKNLQTGREFSTVQMELIKI